MLSPSPSPRAAGTLAVDPTAHSSSSPEPSRLSYSAACGTPSRASDDSCVVNDVDAFVRTIAAIRSKPPATAPGASCSGSGSSSSSLAAVLSHYAARWLPDAASSPSGRFLPPPESPTAAWLKKRLLLESLVAALPPDDASSAAGDGVTCDFLLRLLRAGSTVGADAAMLGDLEARAARRLDQASLAAVMIPAFGGLARGGAVAATLLDVPLVLRLVRGFLREGGVRGGGAAAATARVARLVDSYLAEAALEVGLRPREFEELARAVPAHARAADDGLYRAVDTYLKAHPRASKEERRSLCRLIDPRKLSAEAAAHAVQNDRLPVRCVVQVLFLSEHGAGGKLGHHRLAEWSGVAGSFRDLQTRSPAPSLDLPSSATAAIGTGGGARCLSKRELAAAQHHELRRLREDVARLQVQCRALQAQVDRLSSEGRRRRGLLSWGAALLFRGGGGGPGASRVDDSDSAVDRTPLSAGKQHGRRAGAATPATGTPTVARWRRSHS
ncbi:unnamed protein product [Urochloa humidicola]